MYKIFSLVEIVVAAIVPFFAGLTKLNTAGFIPILTGIFGVLVVILKGVEKLFRFQENWITYRTTVEQLKREKILFDTHTSPYDGPDAFYKFVENFEAALQNENRIWKGNWMGKVITKTEV